MTRAKEILERMNILEENDFLENRHETVVLDNPVNGFTVDGKKIKVKKGHYSLIGNDEDRKDNVLISDREYELYSISRADADVM